MGSFGSKQSKNMFDRQNTQSFVNSSSYNLGRNTNDISQSSHRGLPTNYPLKMPIEETFKCDQCGMIFPDDEALFKHKTRFCIGVKDSGVGRKLYYLNDEDNNTQSSHTNPSVFRNSIRRQSPVQKKREEINEWKNQRSILQSVQDMEDRILRDSQKTQKLANDLKKRTNDYNGILTEYEQLQEQERDLLRQMFNLQAQPASHLNHQSNDLTDHDKSQLEVLQRQNARLEQERRIIQNKLEALIASTHQPSSITNYEPYRLLEDMKDQQDYNENTLSLLRRRLIYPNSDIPTLPYINSNTTRFDPRTVTNDVRSWRNEYLRTGGHDADLIARYTDLEHRLRSYEYYPWMKSYPEPLQRYRYRPIRSTDSTTEQLKLSKNENQRLQNELNEIQNKFQKLNSRTRQLELTVATNATSDSKPNTYPPSKTDHYSSSLPHTSTRQNYDNDLLDQHRNYYQSSLPTLDRRITSYVKQPTNVVTSNMNKLRDSLVPQPYDPVRGFVTFFDFIINFPSTIEQCRLITCLHHAQSGLGEPSPLAPVKCDLYVDEKTGERMNVALIATKQPVPSCPPQQILTIIIEIQTTTNQAPHEPLRTNAWTKIPLFDHKNRLISGRWKVPLRTLPIHQDESISDISSMPTFGHAELHYRLVNSQDALDQSNGPLSASIRDLYFYPPQD